VKPRSSARAGDGGVRPRGAAGVEGASSAPTQRRLSFGRPHAAVGGSGGGAKRSRRPDEEEALAPEATRRRLSRQRRWAADGEGGRCAPRRGYAREALPASSGEEEEWVEQAESYEGSEEDEGYGEEAEDTEAEEEALAAFVEHAEEEGGRRGGGVNPRGGGPWVSARAAPQGVHARAGGASAAAAARGGGGGVGVRGAGGGGGGGGGAASSRVEHLPRVMFAEPRRTLTKKEAQAVKQFEGNSGLKRHIERIRGLRRGEVKSGNTRWLLQAAQGHASARGVRAGGRRYY
jgi:hypothetical protein